LERISFLDAQLKCSFVVKKTSLAFPERKKSKEKKIISTEKQKKNVRCGAVAKYRNAAAAQL
jgi:hypothetical protein